MGLTDFPPVEVEERRSRRGHLSLRGWEGTGRGAPPRRARFNWEECEKEAVGPSPSTRALSPLPLPQEADLCGVRGWASLLSDFCLGSAHGRLKQEMEGLEERRWFGNWVDALHSRAVTWAGCLPTCPPVFPCVCQASRGLGRV